MKVRTSSVHFDADQKLISFIESKLQKLEKFFKNIIKADVVLKLENTGQVKDKIVEIKLDVPGKLMVVKESSKSFEASIDKATDVLVRQLKRNKEKKRRA